MSSTRSSRGLRLVIVGGALVAAFALPAAVSADTTGGGGGPGGATMTVASVSVVGKAVAIVHLDIVCQPFDSYDWDTGETYPTTAGSIEFSVLQVLQAQGRTLDSGTTEFFGTVTCDGATVNRVDANVAATVSPWKNGTAVVSGQVSISDSSSFTDLDSANLGPTTVRLVLH